MSKHQTQYLTHYTPALLESIPRKTQRQLLGITGDALPFTGHDFWHAWEFTWLNKRGKPVVAVLRFQLPCESSQLMESKSLKLYLGSFSQTQFAHADEVQQHLSTDFSRMAEAPVAVTLLDINQVQDAGLGHFQGTSLDTQDLDITAYTWAPTLLQLQAQSDAPEVVAESLYTHLFKCLCPMTGQPDHASILVQYRGAPISHAGLLKYLVSYRKHAEFGEQITERIFVDLLAQCAPDSLAVTTRYTRRGGIDINARRTLGEESLLKALAKTSVEGTLEGKSEGAIEDKPEDTIKGMAKDPIKGMPEDAIEGMTETRLWRQ